MPRIRSIHPALWTDEAYMQASAFARLLMFGLWTEAFDDGVFAWKPVVLKARLFPADNVNCDELLAELEGLDIIRRIDDRHGAIRNFCKFQRPKKPNSSGALPDSMQQYVALSGAGSEPVPHQPETDPEIPALMEEGGGKMDKDKKAATQLSAREKFSEDERRCREAAGFPDDKRLGTFQPIAETLAAGLSLEGDVLPAIKRIASQRSDVGSWQYFAPALLDLVAAKERDKPGDLPSCKPYSGEWFAILIEKIRKGENVGAFMQRARDGTAWTYRPEDLPETEGWIAYAAPTAEQDASEGFHRWSDWFAEHGARLPDRVRVLTVPAEFPPASERAA